MKGIRLDFLTDLSFRPLKIWFIVIITLATSAFMVRAIWELAIVTAVGSIVIMILLILVVTSMYAFALYFTIRPNLKLLRSRPVRIWATALLTACMISGIIHFVRFVPSPESVPPWSVVIAILLLLTEISIYFLLLRVIWSSWKIEGSRFSGR